MTQPGAEPGRRQAAPTSGMERLRSWGRGLSADPAVRVGLAAFLGLRIVTALWAVAARQLVHPAPFVPDPVLRPYLGVAVETNPLLEPWQRWDTLHYQAIAERGYGAFDSALFTPPLYPALIQLAANALGGRSLLAGILVSNAACLLGLIVLARLAFFETNDGAAARRSVLYMVSFPAAFFLVAAYAESLFMLAAGLVLLHARREQWLRAGLWAGIAAMTRSTGVLLLLPLAYQVLVSRRSLAAWASLAIASAGALAFPTYVWLALGLPPWQPLVVLGQRAGGGFAVPGWNLVQAIRQVFAGEFYPADLLDIAALVIFAGLLVPVWRRLPRIHGVYTLAFMGLYLVRLPGDQPLLATVRYVLALLPAFIILGSFGQDRRLHRLILYPCWAGLMFMSGQFAIWGWVG